ncbi:uracil-DNA glycosylase family protein [Allosphingosinicella vermicomposti]|uniref:uracil-DNA glycosylase family protein n=1 Tax=Allosphingosinicella vermicomposti TaxID=614671 RepID=UPI000D10797F|nr:uracil-DNA glycosylase family protein [Allosphingosinicella vermicomposti]
MSALQWWIEAGVDTMVSDEPRDWLRPKTVPVPAGTPEAKPAPASPAQEALPATLDLFQAYLRDSDALPYSAPRAPRVIPSGDPASGLMIMIDMPSEDCLRDRQLIGGEAGRLFDRILAAIGRDRTSVYLAALSCFRAPSGVLAKPEEDRCAEIARHHVGLSSPRALLLMGDGAARALTGQSATQARGRWHEVATPSGPVRAIATLSPQSLISHPRLKAHAWADLQMLMEGFEP